MAYTLTEFANQPTTTVTSGGTGAPASGSSEQWTVASSVSFPTASTTTIPTEGFSVADTANTSEIIAVTAITSNVWGVTRGAENTTPVAHSAGFGITQVVTAGDYQGFAQHVQQGSTSATTVVTTPYTIMSYTVATADAPAVGVVYDLNAFGILRNGTGGFTISTVWNGTTIATSNGVALGTLGTNQVNAPWWFEGRVCCFGTGSMTSGFNFTSAGNTATTTHTVSTLVGASSTATSISGANGPLTVVAISSAMTITTAGVLAHRIS